MLAMANIRVARVHMNKPHDLNGNIKISTGIFWGMAGGQSTCEVIGRTKKKTRKQIGGAMYVGTAL